MQPDAETYEALRAERDQLQRSMLLIHTWLGRALERKPPHEGLIEDAFNEASERVKLDV